MAGIHSVNNRVQVATLKYMCNRNKPNVL